MKQKRPQVIKTQDEKREEYLPQFVDALDELMKHGNNATKAKLSKECCAAMLTLGFNNFFRPSKFDAPQFPKEVP